MLGLPSHFARKAEALHLADRTSEALESSTTRKHWPIDMNSASGVLNCMGCAVCFWRLWPQHFVEARLVAQLINHLVARHDYARNGATPVPGPTIIIGTCGLSGGRNGIVGLRTKPNTVASTRSPAR